MVSEHYEQTKAIVAIRYPGEIVLRADTETWKSLRVLIQRLCAEGASELSYSALDGGAEDQSTLPALNSLVFRQGKSPLLQSLIGSGLVIEGSCKDLLALFENIDCLNPFPGAHYHSDSIVPGVHPDSIALVFLHETHPTGQEP